MTTSIKKQHEQLNKNYHNEFWRFYDLYRRGKLTLEDFAESSHLTKEEILIYLKELSKEAFKAEHFVL